MPTRSNSTPSSSTVLEDLRALQRRVVERIQELEPYAEELTQLRTQAESMGIDPAAAPDKRSASASPAIKRPRARRATAASGRSRRRAATGGQSRAEQVLAIVRDQPGITIPAVGKELGVDSTGLYRVVRSLEADGQLSKQGRQLQPAGAQASAAAE